MEEAQGADAGLEPVSHFLQLPLRGRVRDPELVEVGQELVELSEVFGVQKQQCFKFNSRPAINIQLQSVNFKK